MSSGRRSLQATMMDIHLFTYWDSGAQTQSFTFQTSTLSLSDTSTLHRYLKLDSFQKPSELMSLTSTLSWLVISVPGKVVWMPDTFFLIQSHIHYRPSLWLLKSLSYISSQEVSGVGCAWRNCFCRLEAPLSGNAAAEGCLPYLPKVWQYSLIQWTFLSALVYSLSYYHLLWIIGVLFEILRKIYLHVAQTLL